MRPAAHDSYFDSKSRRQAILLQLAGRIRELAMFDLGIDSKLRACDLMQIRVKDVCHGDRVAARAIVMQQKTKRPVQFEITEQTRGAVSAWIMARGLRSDDFLFRVFMAAPLAICPPASILGSFTAGSVN
jgi:hypothetical protein